MSLPISDEAIAPQTGLSLAPLASVLETIEHGIVLLGPNSHACFRNSAAERILVADGEHGVIAREMHSVSRAALMHRGGRPAETVVATRAGRYRMRATVLRQRIREIRTIPVLVTIKQSADDVPTRASLMQRFGMTPREADVALLLARGSRNTAIAEELDISTHTARHHTENVMMKLQVHARSEVMRAIVDGFGRVGTRQP